MDNVQTMKRYLMFTLVILMLLGIIIGCVAPGPDGNITTPPQTTSSSPTPTITGDYRACSMDSDCVPEQCCHPTSCINRRFKGVCTVFCTQICEGPIDCGAGHCECGAGTCQVIPGAGPKPILCTMEARICPDGSAVGRTGPNCEFSPCPAEDSKP